MRRFALVVVATLALAAAWAVPAYAGSQRVKREEVPQACLDAVSKRLPNSRLVFFHKSGQGEEVTYAITARNPHRCVTYSCAPDGRVLSEREKMKQQDLPDPVKSGLAASRHAQGKVLRTWRVSSEEKPEEATFELLVNTEGHRYDVTFDKDGHITKEAEHPARASRKKAAPSMEGGK